MADIEAAGFFSGAGKLRSQDELEKADQKIAQTKEASSETASDSPEAASDAFVEQTRGVFQNVRSRVNTQVSEIASNINEKRKDLKEARSLVKDQLEVAKELKTFVEQDQTDSPEFERKVQEYQAIRSRRNELSDRIDRNNRESSGPRKIRLGNEEKGNTIEIHRVEFSQAREVNNDELATKDGIQDEIRSLREDRQSLRDQIGDNRELTQYVKDTAKNIRTEISQIENSIENLAAAEDTVAAITRTITQTTNADVLQAANEANTQEAVNPHKGLTPERVTQLLQSG